jgi:hypothetical protein
MTEINKDDSGVKPQELQPGWVSPRDLLPERPSLALRKLADHLLSQDLAQSRPQALYFACVIKARPSSPDVAACLIAVGKAAGPTLEPVNLNSPEFEAVFEAALSSTAKCILFLSEPAGSA